MSKKCIVCGRPLKTGRKYCYVCRSIRGAKGKREIPSEKTDVEDPEQVLLKKIDDKTKTFWITLIVGVFCILVAIPTMLFIWWLGLIAMLFGALMFYLAIKDRKELKSLKRQELTLRMPSEKSNL